MFRVSVAKDKKGQVERAELNAMHRRVKRRQKIRILAHGKERTELGEFRERTAPRVPARMDLAMRCEAT